MGSWQYNYDGVGNLTSQKDGRNQWLYLEYDALDRLSKKRQDSPTGPVIAEYLYDATGQKGLPTKSLAYASQGTIEVYNAAYDARNRLTQQNWTVPGAGGGTFRMDYGYNAADQRTTLRYPGGNGGQQGELVTYNYNAVGQLNQAVSDGGAQYLAATTYNPAGQVTAQQLDVSPNGLTRQYVYETNTLRLNILRAGTASPWTNRQNLSYTYDNAGNITTLTDGVNSNQKQCFQYDWLGRLTAAFTGNSDCTAYSATGAGPYNHTYAYNAIGNITSYNGNAYTYGSQPHAVTGAFGNTYGYDAVGNQTSRTIGGTAHTLTYDYENRLTAVSGGSVSATFLYDADGNRVKGTVNGVTTVYIAGVYEYQNGANTKYYEGGAIRRSGYASGNGITYALSDHLHSTSVLVNQNGTLNTNQYYYPYGGNRNGAFSSLTTKRFTGQYHEQGLPGGEGLYFYNARWYDGQLGRFVSADTVVPEPGNPQSLNRYSYVLGNPLRYVDPSGHAVCIDAGCSMVSHPVSGNVMVRNTAGSALYAMIRNVSTRRDTASNVMRQVLRETSGAGILPGRLLRPLDRWGGNLLHAHFGGLGASRGDAGFAPEFQDDHLYRELWGINKLPESRQVGHFLTAVDMGMQGGFERTVVSHELSTDQFMPPGGPFGGALYQMWRGASPAALNHFWTAILLDSRGDYYARDQELGAIFLDPSASGAVTERRGNSMEDLRLSVRGYRLGQMLATGDPSLVTNRDLANWLVTNIVEGGYGGQ